MLGACDLLAFVAFAALGRASHELSASRPLLATLLTAAPFIAAWAVVAPLMELLGKRRGAFESWWHLMALTTLTWLVAGPLGIVVRSIALNSPIVVSFALVAMGVTGGILLFLRSVYWIIYRRLLA